MAEEVKIWYDKEGDYLEVLFDRKAGYFRETENDAVMEKVDTEGNIVGFGGLENVRFRAAVRPGDRLVVVGQGVKVHRRQSLFTVQGFVGPNMAFHADVIGVPLPAAGEG